MVSLEPRVVWPNLNKPVVVRRDLVFVQGKDISNGTQPERRFLVDIPLEVLVNHSLYIVLESANGLRKGQVLSRNFMLAAKYAESQSDPANHHFIRYDGVNQARRALGRLYGNYEAVEAPILRGWRQKLDWMLQMSWSLHKLGEDDSEFVWVAEQIAKEQSRVRNLEKVSAVVRTKKAGTKKDATGRVNTGMIPLLCSAASRSLVRRTQAIRGIGRRMDWRAVVLESYIDQLRESCRGIQRAARQRLVSRNVFGDKRTRKSVVKTAERMRVYSKHLESISARPFSRAFTHVSADLMYAASQMDVAAETLDPLRMDPAAAVLRRVYRSMMMLEYHWRLEEVLVVLADFHHRKVEIEGRELTVRIEELMQVHSRLTGRDSFTSEPLEEGFRNSILPNVVSNVHLARLALLHGVEDGQSKTSVAYAYLKEACAPF